MQEKRHRLVATVEPEVISRPKIWAKVCDESQEEFIRQAVLGRMKRLELSDSMKRAYQALSDTQTPEGEGT